MATFRISQALEFICDTEQEAWDMFNETLHDDWEIEKVEE